MAECTIVAMVLHLVGTVNKLSCIPPSVVALWLGHSASKLDVILIPSHCDHILGKGECKCACQVCFGAYEINPESSTAVPVIAAFRVASVLAFKYVAANATGDDCGCGERLETRPVRLLATVNMGSCTMWLALIDEFL